MISDTLYVTKKSSTKYQHVFLAKTLISLISAVRRLTSVVLPKSLNVDDMRLEVWLCRFHIYIVSHVVHAIFEAAVLAVRALQARLPRSSNRVLSLLSFWEFTTDSVKHSKHRDHV